MTNLKPSLTEGEEAQKVLENKSAYEKLLANHHVAVRDDIDKSLYASVVSGYVKSYEDWVGDLDEEEGESVLEDFEELRPCTIEEIEKEDYDYFRSSLETNTPFRFFKEM